MVDPEKRARRPAVLPGGATLARREPEQLQRVAIGVAELERPHRAIRRRQQFGTCLADATPTGSRGHMGIGGVHVADHDRQMLEPQIVAPAIGRIGPARRVELHKGDFLPAQTQHDLPCRSHAKRRCGRLADGFPADRVAAERAAIKRRGSVHIRNHTADPQDALRPLPPVHPGCQRQRGRSRPGGMRNRHAPRRCLIPSATRSALAMIVRVGFTAPIDGKKLASVTYRLSRSCALQSTSRTELVGSVPKRHVPA